MEGQPGFHDTFPRPLALALGLLALPATAQEAPHPSWAATFMLGGSAWPGLKDVALPPAGYDTVDLGAFKTTGINVEIGVYRTRPLQPGLALVAGGEFGMWWHGSGNHATFSDPSGRLRVEAEPAANGGHLSGSVRLTFPREGMAPFVGVGAGWYMLVIKEHIGDMVVDTDARANAPGGFLTAGLDWKARRLPVAFRIDGQVHLVSFGGSALRGQRVQGPIYTLRAGASFQL